MDVDKRDWEVYRYEKRAHNPTVCSSTLAMLCKGKVALLTVAPTQNKDLGSYATIQQLSTYRPRRTASFWWTLICSTWHTTMWRCRPYVCPLILMVNEYCTHEYNISYIDCWSTSRRPRRRCRFMISSSPAWMWCMRCPTAWSLCRMVSCVRTVSFMWRITRWWNVWTWERRRPRCYSPWTRKSLLWMCTMLTPHPNSMRNPNPKWSRLIRWPTPPCCRLLPLITMPTSRYVLVARSRTTSTSSSTCLTHHHIRVVSTHADLVKHKYLFDMGYPYYMRVRENRLAVTSDLGILVYSLWSPIVY